jgi:hypothetical protein
MKIPSVLIRVAVVAACGYGFVAHTGLEGPDDAMFLRLACGIVGVVTGCSLIYPYVCNRQY